MRRLAKEIAPPQERPEALRSAERELARVIEDQKDLIKDTEKAAGEVNFDRWLDAKQNLDPRMAKIPRDQLRSSPALQQQFNAQRNGQAEALAGLESKQGDLAATATNSRKAWPKLRPRRRAMSRLGRIGCRRPVAPWRTATLRRH